MKLTKIAVLAGLFLGIFGIPMSSAFSDLPSSHWAYDKVNKMQEKGVISGYTDGTFRPQNEVTREEFATILSKALDLTKKSTDINFRDVSSDRWSKKYIDAVSLYLTGYEANGEYYFKPEEAAVREDMAVAVVKARGLENETPDYTILDKFSDKALMSENMKKYIAIAVKNGIMNGNADGTFNPKGNLTRAEITALMWNVTEKIAIGDMVERIEVLPESIEIHNLNVRLATGETENLSVSLSPNNTTNKSIVWTSSNEDVATVNSSGTVTSKNIGTTVIIAKSVANPSLIVECKVIVTMPEVAKNLPTLKPSSQWYAGDKEDITKITFLDKYTPTDKEQFWISDESNLGMIKCYVQERELIIAGNGTGKIMANADSSFMFATYQNLQQIEGLDILDTSKVTDMRGMFQACNSLQKLNLSNWDTSNVTDMQGMFQGCISLWELNVSNWNTSKVTTTIEMFESCESLRTLELSNWNTSKVIHMGNMFRNCSSLAGLNVKNWDTVNVTYMHGMFSFCPIIAFLDVSNWKTDKVTDMSSMFYGDECLVELDVSKWNTSKVILMGNMFRGCHSLKQLDVSNWEVNNVKDMSYMFFDCISLEDIDVSNWDIDLTANISNMIDEK